MAASGESQLPASSSTEGLAAGCGWPVRTLTGCLVWALAVVVPASRRGGCCLSFVGLCICGRVACTRDVPVEALFPQGGGCLELATSGWSWVLGVDPVGGPPYVDFTDEGDVRPTARCSPDRWRAVPPSVTSDLVGEVGDQRGALCKVLAPNGMIMKR